MSNKKDSTKITITKTQLERIVESIKNVDSEGFPSAWSLLKDAMTRNDYPKTMGWYVSIFKAAQVFIRILPALKDREFQVQEFNKDEDVKEAFIYSKEAEHIGMH